MLSLMSEATIRPDLDGTLSQARRPHRQAEGPRFSPLSLNTKFDTPRNFQFMSKAYRQLQPRITCEPNFTHIRKDHKMLGKIHSSKKFRLGVDVEMVCGVTEK